MKDQSLLDDEVDFSQCVNIILKHKKAFSITFCLFMLIAGVKIFMMPDAYEARARIKIGHIDKPVISFPELRENTKTSDFLKSLIKEGGLSVSVSELREAISFERIKETDFVEIKASFGDARSVLLMLKQFSEKIVFEGNKLYDKRMGFFNKEIERLEAGENRIQGYIDSVNNEILMQKNKGGDSLQKLVSDYEIIYSQLSQRTFNIQKECIGAEPFKVMEMPEKAIKIDGREKKKMLMIAFIAGVVLAVFVTFILEFLKKIKNF